VQIYNLVTPAPPPGYVSDATQVAALITSPGAAEQPAEPVQVAEAAPSEVAKPAAPEAQPKPILVASAAPAEAEPATVAASASANFDDDSETMCVQAANLADWNPFLPCTPTKAMKIVVKPKIIIGAEPPKSLESAPSKPVVVASAPKAPEPQVVAPKAPEPKVAAAPAKVEPKAPEKPKIIAKTVIGASAPEPKSEPAAEVEETEDDSGSCMQGATLADWNPDLPCTADGNSSTLRIEVKE